MKTVHTNCSVTKLIDGLSYETSQNTPHPARMTHWSGGICSGLLDEKFSYVNVFTNEIISGEFDIYEYKWSLDIDGETILLIKENGHWVSIVSFLVGGAMMLISWFLCR